MIFVFRLQPSHADKAADPKVLKWMTDLTKIRKQLKGKSGCVGRGGDMGVEFLIGRVICYWEVLVQGCSLWEKCILHCMSVEALGLSLMRPPSYSTGKPSAHCVWPLTLPIIHFHLMPPIRGALSYKVSLSF